jgi:hypothetical protein
MLTLGACGDDDGDGGGEAGTDGEAGASGGGAGMSGGSGGAGGRAGSSSTAGTGAAGTGMIPMIMCSDTAPTTPIECGGETCPTPMLFMGMDLCSRPCCVMDGSDEVCGVKNTGTMMPTDCALPPQPDDRCPDYTDSLMTMREGCCTEENTCGVVSMILGTCVTTSMLVPTLPATPPDCDSVDADGGN